MKISKLLNIDVKSLVLIILIPILTILISFMAWLSYEQMYNTILHGFNQKLIAVSSTTGSFIDGDEHAKLAKAKEVKALAIGPNERLYAIDSLNHLLRVDFGDGSGVSLFKLDYNINDFTYNPQTKLFYATTGKEIITINPKNGDTKSFYRAQYILKGLAYDALKKNIYFSNGKVVFQIDKNQEVKSLYENEYSISSLAYDVNQKRLYAIEDGSDNLIYIDIAMPKRIKLLYNNFPDESTGLKAIEIHKDKLYSGNRHLIVYDRKKRISAYKDFSRGYRNEKSNLYKKYIAPMTKIKVETGLTYHYTQNLVYNKKGVNCLYILDVHEGNEYTPIGSEDEMDKSSLLGAENVMLRKEVYVSDIKKWEQWGLLKVSFAPIVNAQGIVKAIAGADVDMGIITKKTKKALIESIVVGVISLIISIIAAFSISQKIIEPIRKLKYSALRIAAGRYGDKVFVQNPKELSELSSTFNSMDDQLKDTVFNLAEYNSNILIKRKEQDIQRELDQRLKVRHRQIRSHIVECSQKVDGFLLHENIMYFWFSPEDKETRLDASKERELISTTLSTIINHAKDPLDELNSIFTNISSFGKVELKNNTISLHEKSQELSVLFEDDDGSYTLQKLSKDKLQMKDAIIFAELPLLKSLNKEQIDFLVYEKYSQLKIEYCSILFAVLPKGES